MVDRNIRKAFALAKKVTEHPDEWPDRFVAIPLDAKLLHQLLTPERIRLLNELREKGPFDSVQRLARHLRRDVTRVSRDLTALEGGGIVRLVRNGKVKKVSATRKPILLI